MSIEGIRIAKWIARVQPRRAQQLAAELRNAMVPASYVAHNATGVVAEDVRISVDHVLAIAEALWPLGKPTGKRTVDPMHDSCPSCGCTSWRVMASPQTPIVVCDGCGRSASDSIAPPERDSSGGVELPAHTCAWCGKPIHGEGVMVSEQWYHVNDGCQVMSKIDEVSRG